MLSQEKIDALAAALAAAFAEAFGEEEEAAAPVAAKGKKKRKAAEPAVTLDDVRSALIALSEAKDKQAVIEVLSRFGIGKIGDLREEDYAECKKLAEAETAADENGDEDEEDPFA